MAPAGPVRGASMRTRAVPAVCRSVLPFSGAAGGPPAPGRWHEVARAALCTVMALVPALGLRAAEAPPAPADLGALLAEAESASPAIRAAAARLESARRLPSQAHTLPDPEV